MSSDQHDEVTVHHTTDPVLARTLIDERGGYPAHLAGSEGQGDRGLLRIGFPDVDEEFTEISWDQFREQFEAEELAALYTEDEDATVDGTHPMRLRPRDDVGDE